MRTWLSIPAMLVLASATFPASGETRLLRQPDVSDQHIVFAYAADLWVVDRDGGAARRLTSFQGVESDPKFSPDGTMVAFSGQYDGNVDVYVVPVEGGEPSRLTWHPGADAIRGWTNDGSRVVFASGRTNAPVPYPKLWTIALEGGFSEPMPMPRAWRGAFSPDGTQFAYEPVASWETEWRNYRGGQNKPIWVLDLENYALQKLPWDGSNDTTPVYIGDTIYFLSDRDFAVNVWAYDTTTRRLEQLTHFKEFDARNLEAGGGVLVFEQAGYIHLLDPAMGYDRVIPITVRGDFSWARPHWEDVAERLVNGQLSPTGKRAVFEARGDIFTVPAKKGNVRNLTRTPGVADRAPAWSPDGRWISWFSDEGGEYHLVIANQHGSSPGRSSLTTRRSSTHRHGLPIRNTSALATPTATSGSPRLKRATPTSSTTRATPTRPERSTPSGRPTPSGSPTRSDSTTSTTPCGSIRWSPVRRTRSRTGCPTVVRPPGTPAASTSTSWPAPILD